MSIEVADAENWRLTDPVTRDGKFLITASNIAAGGETLEAEVPHVWQNLLQPSDINNDGSVTAGDALRIINELTRRAFSDGDSQNLMDPLDVEVWPSVYFDQNGDDRATAVDALRVINDMTRQSNSIPASESLASVLDALANPAVVLTPESVVSAEQTREVTGQKRDVIGPKHEVTSALTSVRGEDAADRQEAGGFVERQAQNPLESAVNASADAADDVDAAVRQVDSVLSDEGMLDEILGL